MANYIAAPIPSAIIKTMLSDHWDDKEGLLLVPDLIDVNEAEDRRIRADIRSNSQIVIRSDLLTEEETPIGMWVYGNRITKVLLEVYTYVSRQRLYDLVAEIRRVCHERMHELAAYQRIQYRSFSELTQENVNVWVGRVIIELVNSAILLEA